ncbi:MAG: hypothetical protein ACYDCJ_12885 [Gammaproteobacteria bacterium]
MQDLANQTLALAKGNSVAPGQVTAVQQRRLNAMQVQGDSVWAQYFRQVGLNAASFDAPAMVKQNVLSTQADWSQIDLKGGFAALNLSSQDMNDFLKYQQAQNAATTQELISAAMIVATIIAL